MDLTNYFLDAPADLLLTDKVNEVKLLKVYAFNAYFNADSIYTDNVNAGCTYRRDSYSGIDGVFINETLEENTIECVHSYFVGAEVFKINYVFNYLLKISSEIEDVRKGRIVNNKEADDLLKEYLNEADNKKIIIRIITDYSCDPKEKYEISKKIESFNLDAKNVTAVIVFGDDVKTVIESNRAPFDWVEEGKLVVDEPNNFLKFKDHSIVCNISALSLKKLWEAEGNRGLLAMNLRYYIKSTNIDSKIEDSILFDSDDFWYLNNGIIIVCNDYKVVNNEVWLKQFSIVNGGQTSRMIGTIPFENDFYISCKIIKNIYDDYKQKNIFISKVAEASNTQKPIKAKDIIANRIEQRNLKSLMQDNGIFLEIKRGEKYNRDIYPEPWQRSKNNELAQDLYSFVFMEPGPARNSVSSILSSNDKYSIIFKDHEYSFEFLKDLLFLEKAYKEYQKYINKQEDLDEESAIKKGLVKNGLWYCLATIGYILKIYYNKEYANDIYKYRNFETKYNLYSSELAFLHGFIDKQYSYKQFKKIAFELFDVVFAQLITVQFKLAREVNPSIAYSNWTKSNTGFNNIRSMVNLITFDNKNSMMIDAISKYFVKIDEDTQNDNIDRYFDYCKKNKKIRAKNNLGNEIVSENDEALRNELMLFRYDYANKKHIQERTMFTDKAIDKLIIEKPVTINELKKIISPNTCFYCGQQILDIISKYL